MWGMWGMCFLPPTCYFFQTFGCCHRAVDAELAIDRSCNKPNPRSPTKANQTGQITNSSPAKQNNKTRLFLEKNRGDGGSYIEKFFCYSIHQFFHQAIESSKRRFSFVDRFLCWRKSMSPWRESLAWVPGMSPWQILKTEAYYVSYLLS